MDIKLFDPTAAPAPKPVGLAPRPGRLTGLRLGLVENTKFNSDTLLLKLAERLGRDHGMSERQVREFLFYRESDAFSALERLVIDYAAGMSKTPVDVPDELFAQLHEQLDEAQLVELTAEIALENYRGRFNKAFGLGSEGFAAGDVTAEAEPATA